MNEEPCSSYARAGYFGLRASTPQTSGWLRIFHSAHNAQSGPPQINRKDFQASCDTTSRWLRVEITNGFCPRIKIAGGYKVNSRPPAAPHGEFWSQTANTSCRSKTS